MYDEITRRLRELGAFANGITPSRFYLEPTREDGVAIVDDLFLLAKKVDAVIEAYGLYCESNGIIGARDLKTDFIGVLESALAGNATYAIESGIEKRIEDAREAAE